MTEEQYRIENIKIIAQHNDLIMKLADLIWSGGYSQAIIHNMLLSLEGQVKKMDTDVYLQFLLNPHVFCESKQ